MKKKMVSLLLCTAMLIGLLPTVALAEVPAVPSEAGLYYRQVNVTFDSNTNQDVYELDEGNTAYQSEFVLDPSRAGYAQFYYCDGTNDPIAVAPGFVTASAGVTVESIPGYTDFAKITVTGFFTNGTISCTDENKPGSITVTSELPEVGFYQASAASAENYLTTWDYDAENFNTIYLVAKSGAFSSVTVNNTDFTATLASDRTYVTIIPRSDVTLVTGWVSVDYEISGHNGNSSIQFNVPGGGGSGDPQPGGPFTPGIRINDRGVPLTVVGAESPQNDGNYTFDENVTTATVTFTDEEDRVRGLAVRVFDSNGLVSSNRLQQKTYTINDVNKFYEIEVIDYNAIFDNQYRADYDNSDGKTVKVGDVTLDGNNAQTFEKGQTITFIASTTPYKVIVRPNDNRDVELEITGPTFSYTPATDAGFELKVYWSEDEYNYDQFQGTDALPIVVEYTKDSDTALSLSGAEIADTDKITYGNNTKVRVASDVESLTFDWGANTPKRICVEGEDVNLPDTTFYTLNLDQNKTFYRLEFRWNDDPEPDWYSVSWGGGNVTVENGTVTAERVHLGDKTFTVNVEESGASDSDNIFPIEDIIGQQGQEGLGQYGLGYSDTDLFIGNEVEESVSIDFKFVPDYGYQLSDILTNGENSLLNGFTASRDEISTFNFEVRPGGSVHFNVVFTQTEDIIQNNSSSVVSVTIADGRNATDSGNLKLTVADLDENAVSEDLKARAGESVLYLDMNLYQVVNKVTEEGNWENQLQDLNGTITVTLEVPAPAEGSSYYIIREHGDGADRTYSRIEVTFVPDANDPTKGTVTFETDKFSNYALAQAAESATQTADFTASDNGAAALALLNAAKTGSDESTWDSGTNTLTLKGVNFTTSATTAVKLPAGSTIVLADDTINTITGGGPGVSSYCSYGIYADGSLIIKGTGTLTATGGTSKGATTYSCGIYAYGGLTIESGIVNANGGAADNASFGIDALEPMTISGGTVTANGGTADSVSYGIYAAAFMAVTGGNVTATGGTATGTESDSFGIRANKGDVTITGGIVRATGGNAVERSCGIYAKRYENGSGGYAGGNIAISGGAQVIAQGGGVTSVGGLSYGLFANESMTISDSTAKVTANGGDATSAGSESYGIRAFWGDVKIASANSQVIATGGRAVKSCGIYANEGKVIIENGEVNATGGTAEGEAFAVMSYGIFAYSSVNISGGTVNATGGAATNAAGYFANSYGISAGSVAISASAGVEATGGAATNTAGYYAYSCGIYAHDKMDISNNADVTAKGGTASTISEGIEAANVTISDSAKVTATGGAADVGSTGIYAGGYYNEDEQYVNGKVTISGGTVTATGDEAGYGSDGIYADDVTIQGGTVTATASAGAGESTGIYADASVAINSGTVILDTGAAGNTALVVPEADDLTLGTNVVRTGADNELKQKYADTPVVFSDASRTTVTVTGITANDKTYDGTTAATLNYTSEPLTGVSAGDTVSLDTADVAATFADANVGTGKTVTVSGTFDLRGADAYKYSLNQPTLSLTADIAAFTAIDDTTATSQTIYVGEGSSFRAPTFTGAGSEAATGTVTYTLGGEDKTIDEVIAHLNTLTAGETASVEYSFAGTDNYAGASGTGTITVTIAGRPAYIVPTYPVTAAQSENGTVTVSTKNAYAGTTVTVTVKPDEGYELASLTVTNAGGKELTLTDKGDGKYTFTMPGSGVTVTAGFAPEKCSGGEGCISHGFADVDTGKWYHEAIDYVVERGLMKGVGDGLFAPGGDTYRGTLLTILYRLEGEPAVDSSSVFSDVPEGAWYHDAVLWAASNGIVEGYGSGVFGAKDPITREQFAVILYRYARYKGYDVTARSDLSTYTDGASTHSWAEAALSWANAVGIIDGLGENLIDPTGGAIRAQAAQMLHQFCEAVME